LADGRTTYFDVYRGIVVWDGVPRIIELEAADATPLIGTSLLHRHKIELEFVNGGAVTITALP
jgi:predicted aspartyl protease